MHRSTLTLPLRGPLPLPEGEEQSLLHCERGIAAIEFAIIAPVLIFLVIGVADYGMFMNQKMKLQDLTVMAVQYVSQGGSASNVVANVIDTSDYYIAAAAKGQVISVTTSDVCECSGGVSKACNLTCPNAGDYLRHFFAVTLQSTYTPIFAYPGLPASMTLQGYSRIQYNPPS
jgi:Flp pilus assembly protein TadG